MTTYRSLYEKQLGLEKEALRTAARRYREGYLLARKRGTVADLAPEKYLMGAGIPLVVEQLQSSLKTKQGPRTGQEAKKILRMGHMDELAYLALRAALNAAHAGGVGFTHACCVLCEEVLHNLRYDAFKTQMPGLVRWLEEKHKVGREEHKRYVLDLHARRRAEELGGATRIYNLDDATAALVGKILLEAVVIGTGYIRVEKWYRATETQRVILPGKVLVKGKERPLLDFLDDSHARLSTLQQPLFPPMIVKPLPHTEGLFSGGYLCNPAVKKNPLVHIRNRGHRELFEQFPTPKLAYQSLNIVQETAWRINTRVLEVLQKMVDAQGGGGIGTKLPHLSQEEVIPAKPWADREEGEWWRTNKPEEFARYRAEARAGWEAWTREKTKRYGVFKQLRMARQFQEYEEIYFPHYFDSRGRFYPCTPTLNPQGDQVAKSLLMFAEGVPLGSDGYYWLKVHCANVYGKDKLPLDDRVKWVDEHMSEIRLTAQNPLEETFWRETEADPKTFKPAPIVDAPFKFLAVAFEIAAAEAWREEGNRIEDFISHIPVALDATCSAYQHWSVMLRDEGTAELVAVLPGDSPKDIYSEVMGKVNGYLTRKARNGKVLRKTKKRKIGVENVLDEAGNPTYSVRGRLKKKNVYEEIEVVTDERKLANLWLEAGVDRTLCKRGTMTKSYGVTQYGLGSQIRDELKKRKAENGQEYLSAPDENRAAAQFLGTLVEKGTKAVAPSLSKGMEYVQKVVRATVKETNAPFLWVTPLGFPVYFYYKRTKEQRVHTTFGGATIRMSLVRDTDTFDAQASAQASAPSFVHSLDATHLMNIVRESAEQHGIKAFACIHDSVGTHAGNTTKLREVIRETFVELYEQDMLAEFTRQAVGQMGPRMRSGLLPEPPDRGTLDIHKALESEYLFA